MTGDEYFNLKRGSNVTVETPFSCYTEGQVLKVEYIDSLHQQVFLRDTTKSLGDQVKIVDTFFILNNFVVGGKLPEKKNDKVNHPSHYTWLKDLCGIEVIDITRHMDFNLGNSIKYILRSGHKKEEGYTDKQKTIEDLKKAVWYLNDEISTLEKQ